MTSPLLSSAILDCPKHGRATHSGVLAGSVVPMCCHRAVPFIPIAKKHYTKPGMRTAKDSLVRFAHHILDMEMARLRRYGR